jgi:hypothetical protein
LTTNLRQICFSHSYCPYCSDLTYFEYSQFATITFAPTLAKGKYQRPSLRGVRAILGNTNDLMLHCTLGHMRRMHGAQPDLEDGAKALNFFCTQRRAQVYILHILHILHTVHILVRGSLWSVIFCVSHGQFIDFGTTPCSIMALVPISRRSCPRSSPDLRLKLTRSWTANS